MKAILLTLSLLIAFLATGRAVDLVTPAGTFKDIKVMEVKAESIRITHSEGAALVDFDDLPPAMQAEYGWTPEKSAERKAKKAAEAKRMEEEEKAIEDAPKRKAMEEAARKKAEEEKLMAEDRAKRKVENAAFEADSANAQQDLIAAAAKARAELDRERKGLKGKKDEVPVAQVADEPVKEVTETPMPRKNAVKPAFGTVSDVLTKENPFLQNYWVWIGLGVGLVVVIALFMMASGSKVKLPPPKVPRR